MRINAVPIFSPPQPAFHLNPDAALSSYAPASPLLGLYKEPNDPHIRRRNVCVFRGASNTEPPHQPPELDVARIPLRAASPLSGGCTNKRISLILGNEASLSVWAARHIPRTSVAAHTAALSNRGQRPRGAVPQGVGPAVAALLFILVPPATHGRRNHSRSAQVRVSGFTLAPFRVTMVPTGSPGPVMTSRSRLWIAMKLRHQARDFPKCE